MRRSQLQRKTPLRRGTPLKASAPEAVMLPVPENTASVLVRAAQVMVLVSPARALPP